MVKLIILEDEPAALRRIKRIVGDIRPTWEIVGTSDSVKDGITLLNISEYDLILSDIQLSDGICFEIFEKIEVRCPIIFLTAYNDYAIQAFELNSIHYLLKPLVIQKLHLAFQKFEKQQIPIIERLSKLSTSHTMTEKVNLLGKTSTKTIILPQEDLAVLYVSEGYTKAMDFKEKNFLLDDSLDSLSRQLTNALFFRINRQHIINKNAIEGYENYSSNRLLLHLKVKTTYEIIVSKEKTPVFKKWLLGV